MSTRTTLPFIFAVGVAALLATSGAHAQNQIGGGDLIVSGSTFDTNDANANIVAGTTQLPGSTSPVTGGTTVTAVASAAYPYVFNNAVVDGSFGITSPIFLQAINPATNAIDQTVNIPTSVSVTSFSSKSEMALNVSTQGNYITFSGYSAPDATVDVSNSNTPQVYDYTNPVTNTFARSVVQVPVNNLTGYTSISDNAYSGNNQRAVVLDESTGSYFTAGNAGNSGTNANGYTAPLDSLSSNTGVQFFNPATSSTSSLNGATGYNTTVVGAYPNGTSTGNAKGDQYGFSITQLGFAADKTGKDDNFRGLTVAPDGTLYVTKGSGGNGINTVYHVTVSGGGLPNETNASSATIAIAPGFSTTLASASSGVQHPFGLWFANSTTLYVADEGDGGANLDGSGNITSLTGAGGLEKWTFNTLTNTWVLDYVLTNGLNLGNTYTIASSATLGAYPTGYNSYVKKGKTVTEQWAPVVDGLRNITGQVNTDGTVTIYGVTSTVSGSGDQGADPNQIVSITDNLGDTGNGTQTYQPAGESFGVVEAAQSGTVYRGVAVAPEPTTGALALAAGALLGIRRRRSA